jgi:hypothetical protein
MFDVLFIYYTVVCVSGLPLIQPIVDIHWLDGVREWQRLGPPEFSMFVTLLRLWRWLMLWSLLHVGHILLHILQHLSLHDQHLLQCWWWRRLGIAVVVVLMSGTVASVGHLMIVKRFETQIKIEIKYRDTRFPAICIMA